MTAAPAAGPDFDSLSPSQAAAWYAAHGVPVFPCEGKRPLTKHGFKDASTDAQTVAGWWKRWPGANIGIPTGRASGWLVVDVDPRNGGNESFEELIAKHGPLPPTLEAITGGGGRHIVFKYSDGVRCSEPLPGLEIKGDGGYIIVAPSIHPDTKRRYSWDGADSFPQLDAIADPPAWLLQLAREKQPRGGAAGGAAAPGAKIPSGRRNIELTSIAGVLRSRGAGEAELRDLLGAINMRLCEQPLPDDEIDNIARSVARYDPRANAERPDAQRIFEVIDEGRYRLSIPGICAELEADYLRRESGALVCELTVRCHLPGSRGVDGIISVAEFNVSSARARQERAKLIAARAGTKAEEVDWLGIIEEFCQRCLIAERDGGEAVDLSTLPLEDESAAAWWIDGLPVYRRHPNCLYGRGGSCKSLLALYIAIELVRRGHSVLYADFEFDGSVHRERLQKLAGGMAGIHYVRCTRPLVHEAERLRRLAKAHGCSLVIIDSIVLACDGPPESAEVASRFFQALRRIGAGTLLIGHIGKAEVLEGIPTLFGSAFWEYSVRNAWFARQDEQTSTRDAKEVALFQAKTNLGPKLPPRGFRIVFGERITVSPMEVANTPEFARHMTLAQKLEAVLRRGPLKLDVLAEEVDSTPSSIRALISRRPGMFTRLPDGRIALLERRESDGWTH